MVLVAPDGDGVGSADNNGGEGGDWMMAATTAASDSSAMRTYDTYAAAGVDIEEGARAVASIRAAVQSTYTPAVIGDIGGFGGLFDATALKSLARPVLVSATDGVGTKLELAKRLGQHDSVGIDLVAMCVNDLIVTGARPLFFLDYLAVEHLQAELAAAVVGGVAAGCRQAGCALIGGEMAEHPQVMPTGSYDLAGFAVGVVDFAAMLAPARVEAGDAIIGLASTGFHSNGYSLIRRAFTDSRSDAELKATGSLSDGRSLAQALLAPTRIYVPELLHLLDLGLPLHAAAHITGGGITENLNRALPPGLDATLELASWPVPELLTRVILTIGLGPDEALRTFNMGIGMALIVAATAVDDVFAALAAFAADTSDTGADASGCWRIGTITPAAAAGETATVGKTAATAKAETASETVVVTAATDEIAATGRVLYTGAFPDFPVRPTSETRP